MDLAKGDRVIVARPGFTQGGRSVHQDKIGTVEYVSGRYLTVILDDDLDELGFFAREVDKLT